MHLTAVFKFWKRNVGRCLSDSLAELKINVKGTMNNKDIIKLNHNITGKKKIENVQMFDKVPRTI